MNSHQSSAIFLKRPFLQMITLILGVLVFVNAQAELEPAELYCTVRDTGTSLNCQWVNKDSRKMMTADDISTFVDQVSIAAYMTVKSRRGLERTFLIDANAPSIRRLSEIRKSASISELGKVKNDLFTEIEKRAIKVSDDLDTQSITADIIRADPSITYEKSRKEARSVMNELEGYRKKRDTVCTSTPAFEQLSKANGLLQQTLSNILYAFQSPGSCMSDMKIFKDKDGTVDLRQLDGVSQKFNEKCKK